MKLTFYDTRIRKDCSIALIKEKVAEYEHTLLNSPEKVVEMVNSVVSLNVLGEEHCYMLALNTKNKVLEIFFLSRGTISEEL